MPTYESTNNQQPYQMACILGQSTTGTGSRWQSAKHAAAQLMLVKLKGKITLPDGQAATNIVGALQEFCMRHGYSMPTYACLQPDQMTCALGKISTGSGNSKKEAKQMAARAMFDKLEKKDVIDQMEIDEA